MVDVERWKVWEQEMIENSRNGDDGMPDDMWRLDEEVREEERGVYDLLSARVSMLRVDGYLERLDEEDDLGDADDVRSAWEGRV